MSSPTSPQPTRSRSAGPVAVAVLAGIAHLGVGILYIAGGLMVPGAVLFPLWAIWGAFAAWLVYLAVRRSWWTPAVPLLAAALFLVVITVGEQVLGWRG
ncbi:ECF transporter S component family protein [Blastococcus deserti]|uniref:Uncharacterized protein n=1 Tax=Blastococcus deserti TaxID=2259033 RepID=A0ABW4XHM4_9ACTN